MDDRANLGKTGEKRAAKFLRKKRYKIVTRNYHCPAGEIDLVALDGDIVVFIEVKTRSDADHADPEDAVNFHKQKRMARCARFFLQHTGSEGRACRFDVIAITLNDGTDMEIEHFEDAFQPKW